LLQNKYEILTRKDERPPVGIPVPANLGRIMNILGKYKSDPLIPSVIRTQLVEFLEERLANSQQALQSRVKDILNICGRKIIGEIWTKMYRGCPMLLTKRCIREDVV
jgi:hypothetical protein